MNGSSTNKVDVFALGLILFEFLTLNNDFHKVRGGWENYLKIYPDALLEIEDPALRYLVGLMLDPSPAKRPSMKQLRQNDIIQGWKYFLGAKDPLTNPNCSTYFISPFVSLLHPNTPLNVLRHSISRIHCSLQITEIRQGVLKLQLIPSLLKLLKHQYGEPAFQFRVNQVLLEDNTNVGSSNNLSQEIVPSIGENTPQFQDTSFDGMAIQLLNTLLEYPDIQGIVAIEIISSNTTANVIEKYKSVHSGMECVLAKLCTIPFFCREVQRKYGLELILASLMSIDTTLRYGIRVFEALYSYKDAYTLNIFFKQLSMRSSKSIQKHLIHFISTTTEGNEILSPATEPDASVCFQNILSQNFSTHFCTALIAFIIPIREMLKFAVNSQQCTRKLFGRLPISQTTISGCCLSCKECCDEVLVNYTENLTCSCSQQTCKAGNEPQLITESTNKEITIVKQEYHRLRNIYISTIGGILQANIPPKYDATPTPHYFIVGAEMELKQRANNVQFYFEVTIQNAPIEHLTAGVVSVGVSTSTCDTCDTTHELGAGENEFAYRNDGKFVSFNSEIPFGPAFGPGDVIGCGISDSRRLFFTVNGFFVGFTSVTFRSVRPISSVVGIKGHSACITLSYNKFLYKSQSPPTITPNACAVEMIFKNEKVLERLNSFVGEHNTTENIAILMHCLRIVNPIKYQNAIEKFPRLGTVEAPPLFKYLMDNEHELPLDDMDNSELLLSSILVPSRPCEEIIPPEVVDPEPEVQPEIAKPENEVPLEIHDDTKVKEPVPPFTVNNALFLHVGYGNNPLQPFTIFGEITLPYLTQKMKLLYPSKEEFILYYYIHNEKNYILSNEDIINWLSIQDDIPIIMIE